MAVCYPPKKVNSMCTHTSKIIFRVCVFILYVFNFVNSLEDMFNDLRGKEKEGKGRDGVRERGSRG